MGLYCPIWSCSFGWNSTTWKWHYRFYHVNANKMKKYFLPPCTHTPRFSQDAGIIFGSGPSLCTCLKWPHSPWLHLHQPHSFPQGWSPCLTPQIVLLSQLGWV
jgi:hypothetical protein